MGDTKVGVQVASQGVVRHGRIAVLPVLPGANPDCTRMITPKQWWIELLYDVGAVNQNNDKPVWDRPCTGVTRVASDYLDSQTWALINHIASRPNASRIIGGTYSF